MGCPNLQAVGSKPFLLRPVCDTDQAFLLRLYEESRPDLLQLPEELRDNLVGMQFNARESQYAAAWPEADSFIVELEDEAIGRLLISSQSNAIHIIDMALLAEFRGQGLGSAILNTLLQESGDGLVSLTVAKQNPAQRLYARLGFSVVGEDEVNLRMERGT